MSKRSKGKNKKARASIHPAASKNPKVKSTPSAIKSAKAVPTDFLNRRPSWRLSILEIVAPFGWDVADADILNKVRKRLSEFESMTWHEILGRDHHPIPVDRICKDAKKRLADIKQDDIDHVISLHLDGCRRIWGILEMGVLRLLWWDPDHLICPSKKKNT